MLRIVVLALVLANLVLLGLQVLERRAPGGATQDAQPASQGGRVAAITLLSETDDRAMMDTGAAECFAVGPFASETDKAAAMAEIARIAAAMTQRRTEAAVTKGFWVYLPVQPDYLTARSMALTLRDAGFSDADVVMEGDWQHSVSLGFFVNEDNALALAKEARTLGFDARTRIETAVEPRHWIDYEQRVGAPYWQAEDSRAILVGQHRAIPCGPSPGA